MLAEALPLLVDSPSQLHHDQKQKFAHSALGMPLNQAYCLFYPWKLLYELASNPL
jgi:hypothetical protein